MSRQVLEFYSANLENTNKKVDFSGWYRLNFIDFMFFGGYDRAIAVCFERAARGMKTKIFTPNAEMLGMALKDKELLPLLKRAELPLPDGVGVYIAARLLGLSPVERTNGIDFAERLLSEAAQVGSSVFLLGAKPGVAERAALKLEDKYRGLSIVGAHHGYFEKYSEENDEVIAKINKSGAEILFVCLGFPLQERWICDNMAKLKSVKVAVGLGGSLDVWSGEVSRAPAFFRKTGLEWLYRTALSPERIARLPKVFGFMRLCIISKASNLVKQKGNLLQNR